jgi:hypothetical protein
MGLLQLLPLLKWIIKKRETSGGGAYTAFIWLEMRSSAANMEHDDEIVQALPTKCTYK